MTTLLSTHKSHFPEIDSLYTYQEKVLEIMRDGENALAIIPTGGGKSLIYQLLSLSLEGITIVISPLIALMNEQVNDLNSRGINAIALNSNYSFIEQRKLLRNLGKSGEKLLYIAPERLHNPFFRACLIASKIDIALVVVDEAHCISQWGSGFRPDYSQIPNFLTFLNDNTYHPLVLCLTATLAIKARLDIASAFNVKAHNVYVADNVLRTNLNLIFEKVDYEESKEASLRTFLSSYKPKKTIGYLYSKPLTKKYKSLFEDQYRTGYYNADIEPDNREEVYKDFFDGKTELLFATTAFGMGINIPDIESIIHIHIPNSIEEYYQQVGRGWRRKNPVKTCNCIVLWSDKNFAERKRTLLKQKYSTETVLNAYSALLGGADISKVGQILNKSKDVLMNDKSHNLQLLRHKLEKFGIIRTLGELNGSPETIVMHTPTLLWKKVQNAARDGMDSFGYVIEETGISLQEIIDHLYEQDLNNNIKKLPAMQKDIFFEILKLKISEITLQEIANEINEDINYRIQQLEALKELFMGKNINEILSNNLN